MSFSKLKQYNNIRGILFMILHALAMCALYIIVKSLSKDLHSSQIVFLYKLIMFMLVLPWCLSGNYRQTLKTKRIGFHIAHGVFSFLGSLCFFMGMANLPAVNAAAISYIEHIFVLLIGVLYFKEKFKPSKIVMVILSLFGTFLIIKPGIVAFNYHYIYIFLAILFWSLNCAAIKILGRTEKTKQQLFYSLFFASLFSLPMALHEWRPLSYNDIMYLVIIGACYLIHSVAFFKAFKLAEMSVVMPFDYCRLIFTGLLAFIFLNEIPDSYSIIGYLLIIIGGVYSILKEAKRKPTPAKQTPMPVSIITESAAI